LELEDVDKQKEKKTWQERSLEVKNGAKHQSQGTGERTGGRRGKR
jgi:hypothetical protein